MADIGKVLFQALLAGSRGLASKRMREQEIADEMRREMMERRRAKQLMEQEFDIRNRLEEQRATRAQRASQQQDLDTLRARLNEIAGSGELNLDPGRMDRAASALPADELRALVSRLMGAQSAVRRSGEDRATAAEAERQSRLDEALIGQREASAARSEASADRDRRGPRRPEGPNPADVSRRYDLVYRSMKSAREEEIKHLQKMMSPIMKKGLLKTQEEQDFLSRAQARIDVLFEELHNLPQAAMEEAERQLRGGLPGPASPPPSAEPATEKDAFEALKRHGLLPPDLEDTL